MSAANPTDALLVDLSAYVERRTLSREARLIDGVPDYSFALDRQLRSRLSAIGPLRTLARLLVRSQEPLMQQINLMNGIAVGPDQFATIFDMAGHCANKLGIGVPRMFIVHDHAPNAWTYASDDSRPSIVMTTGLVEGIADNELLAIIGHECGHIHNLHSAYNTLGELLAQSSLSGGSAAAMFFGAPFAAVRSAVSLIGVGLQLFLLQWSRAAEITCDRAGAICAGGSRPMIMALAKLKTGGHHRLEGFNVDAYVRQIEQMRAGPFELTQLLQTHPMTQKRMAALILFDDSEGYRAWLPAVQGDRAAPPRAEVDKACAAAINITGVGVSS